MIGLGLGLNRRLSGNIYTDNYGPATMSITDIVLGADDVASPAKMSITDIVLASGSFTPSSVVDASYSWWCNPISVRYGSYNYFSYVDSVGAQILARIDDLGNKISVVVNTGYAKDEHNTPGFIKIGSKIIACYCGHNTAEINRVIYDLDLNITNTDIIVGGSWSYSYSQLIYSNSKLFLFSRAGKTTWRMFISDDEGVTWGSPVVLVTRGSGDVGNLYMSTQLIEGNEILACINLHPITSGDTNRLRKLTINTVTGAVKDSDGTTVNNIYSSFTTIDVTTLNAVYTPPTGEGFRLLDTTSDGTYTYILTATFLESESASDYVSGDYKMLRLDSSGNVTAYTITTHGIDTFDTYFGGAYFVQNIDAGWEGDIYLAKENSTVWTVEKWNFSGGSFTKTETVDTLTSSTLSLTRPKPPYNSKDGGARLIYQDGNYFENYLNWDNELKLI